MCEAGTLGDLGKMDGESAAMGYLERSKDVSHREGGRGRRRWHERETHKGSRQGEEPRALEAGHTGR